MKAKIIFFIVAIICGLAWTWSPTVQAKSKNEETVRKFIEASNSRAVASMMALADPELEWGALKGAKLTIEGKGAVAISATMQNYWKACPSCRSELSWVKESKDRLVALEIASWVDNDNVEKALQSLSVYEFNKDGKILRVYYFPAEPFEKNVMPKAGTNPPRRN